MSDNLYNILSMQYPHIIIYVTLPMLIGAITVLLPVLLNAISQLNNQYRTTIMTSVYLIGFIPLVFIISIVAVTIELLLLFSFVIYQEDASIAENENAIRLLYTFILWSTIVLVTFSIAMIVKTAIMYMPNTLFYTTKIKLKFRPNDKNLILTLFLIYIYSLNKADKKFAHKVFVAIEKFYCAVRNNRHDSYIEGLKQSINYFATQHAEYEVPDDNVLLLLFTKKMKDAKHYAEDSRVVWDAISLLLDTGRENLVMDYMRKMEIRYKQNELNETKSYFRYFHKSILLLILSKSKYNLYLKCSCLQYILEDNLNSHSYSAHDASIAYYCSLYQMAINNSDLLYPILENCQLVNSGNKNIDWAIMSAAIQALKILSNSNYTVFNDWYSHDILSISFFSFDEYMNRLRQCMIDVLANQRICGLFDINTESKNVNEYVSRKFNRFKYVRGIRCRTIQPSMYWENYWRNFITNEFQQICGNIHYFSDKKNNNFNFTHDLSPIEIKIPSIFASDTTFVPNRQDGSKDLADRLNSYVTDSINKNLIDLLEETFINNKNYHYLRVTTTEFFKNLSIKEISKFNSNNYVLLYVGQCISNEIKKRRFVKHNNILFFNIIVNEKQRELQFIELFSNNSNSAYLYLLKKSDIPYFEIKSSVDKQVDTCIKSSSSTNEIFPQGMHCEKRILSSNKGYSFSSDECSFLQIILPLSIYFKKNIPVWKIEVDGWQDALMEAEQSIYAEDNDYLDYLDYIEIKDIEF